MSKIEARLNELGIELPKTSAPVANYLPCVVAGDLVVISGQLCVNERGEIPLKHQGKTGLEVSEQEAALAARQAALNVLAQLKAAVGDLERVKRCVRLGGFVNAAPGFTNLALVMNGASDLMVDVLGDAGRHARATVGVAELPLNACVEVEAIFQIAQ